MATAGTRGPVPKRSSERRRRNKDSKVETVQVKVAAVVEIPKPNADWHAIARDWYVSLAQSGQAEFYEPSDWQFARYVAEAMSRNLNEGKRFSAMLFASVTSSMTELLTTEAARRRVRLEMERGGEPPQDASVTAIADYRKKLTRAAGAKK